MRLATTCPVVTNKKGKRLRKPHAKRPHQKVKRQKAKVLENPMRSDRIKKAKGKRQKT
jgi:hypothetical protein